MACHIPDDEMSEFRTNVRVSISHACIHRARPPDWRGTWNLEAHLELRERERLPQARSRAVGEREDVPVALDLFRFCDTAATGVEPALGLELPRVCAPEDFGTVHVADGGGDDRTLPDDEAVRLRPRRGGYGGGEGDDVVFCRL